jgi:hypothetical protein
MVQDFIEEEGEEAKRMFQFCYRLLLFSSELSIPHLLPLVKQNVILSRVLSRGSTH